MRTLTRSILAATSVVGLLALPVVSATAADTNVNVTLSPVDSTVSITAAPTTTGASTVDLGDVSTGAQVLAGLSGEFTDGTTSGVTVADSSTGLIRTSTTTVTSGLSGGTGLCQGTVADGQVTCSNEANTSIPATSVFYTFGNITKSGNGSLNNTLGISPTIEAGVDAPLGTASLIFTAAAPGAYELSWNPTFAVTLNGQETAGEYYGQIVHTVSGGTVGS